MKTQIITFKDQEIYCPLDENRTVFVAIRPICQALGIDTESQKKRILRDHILSDLLSSTTATGRDSKQYQMDCLPLQFVFDWLFTIDHDAVKQEARDTVLAYKIECNKALCDHFYGSLIRTIEMNHKEIALLEAIAKEEDSISESKDKKKAFLLDLDKLRKSRLNGDVNQLEVF